MAISNATIAAGAQTRWGGGAAGSVASQGGNITMVNVSSVSLTSNWMGFFGNVIGSIVLGNNLLSMYNWTWTPAGGGEVCVAQDPTFDFSAANSTTAAAINSAWGFGSASDNATNTFDQSACNLSFSQTTVNGTASARLKSYSTFTACAISRGVASNRTDFAYCAGINTAGVNYLNQSTHYELMVPSMAGNATDPYYFFAELN
jgi:hypothetical protein